MLTIHAFLQRLIEASGNLAKEQHRQGAWDKSTEQPVVFQVLTEVSADMIKLEVSQVAINPNTLAIEITFKPARRGA